QDLARLQLAVDVGVVAVAVIGELLELAVLQVAHAESEHGEKRALLALLFDEPHHLRITGHADVEVAVGGEDDAIVAVADVVATRDIVREPDPGATRCRAPRLELIDCGKDTLLL